MSRLSVVLVKPSKYDIDGYLETFRWGFMPNSTLPYLQSLTPDRVDDFEVDCITIDEVVQCDDRYLDRLKANGSERKLVCLVGVQSHQMHRALDLAAFSVAHGSMAIIGGPHAMTCDTSLVQGCGVSFCFAEADLVWHDILLDACDGCLKPTYGSERRWQEHLEGHVISPPNRKDFKRYVVPLLGLYPARGCPFSCTFCSVVRIAGHRIRSQPVECTIECLKVAKAAGIRQVMITSDNFNKYPEAKELLEAMIDEKINVPFFIQCDTQIGRQPELLELLGKAGCKEIFLGAECFDRATLIEFGKRQNKPEVYSEIVDLCWQAGISSHFSNIIGFPTQDKSAVREHVAHLIALNPTWASFYILCPIPGTEQYASFLKDEMITEKNLDRFDASCLTWRHPHLSAQELQDLLFESYRSFYSWPRSIRNAVSNRAGKQKSWQSVRAEFGNTFFNRVCAFRRMHPMAGGLYRKRKQNMSEFMPLRMTQFVIDFLPLPANRAVSEEEAKQNNRLREAPK